MTPDRNFSKTLTVVLASLVSAVVVTACGPEQGGDETMMPLASAQAAEPAPRLQPVADRRAQPAPRHIGTISAIEPITESRRTSGAGAVIGGVAGGVLGHQIGDGGGRTAATVIGAAGGAVAGNHVEKRRNADRVVGYRVTVRMQEGGSRTVRVDSRDGLDVGERVRVEGDSLIRL